MSGPTTILLNKCIKEGVWPNIFKREIVTPVPKIYPPKQIEDLTNILGLLTFDKIMENCIVEIMIKDMRQKLIQVNMLTREE